MDPNTAVVAVAIIGIVVPVLTVTINYVQTRATARATMAAAERAAVKVEEVKQDLQAQGRSTDTKLDTIHLLVNSRLTEALDHIEGLKALLATVRAGRPDPGPPPADAVVAQIVVPKRPKR